MKKSESVTLKVYNILGKEVETIFKGVAEAGHTYEFNFDGSRESAACSLVQHFIV
ncbi:MAG: hypothetical protein P8Y79_12005 [Ignavibacteriaceae bacterium]